MKKTLVFLGLLTLAGGAYAQSSIALLASTCAACHGTNGHSISSEMPSLAGLEPAYFIQQMHDFASGKREASVMQHHAAAYSEDEIRALAEYFSVQ